MQHSLGPFLTSPKQNQDQLNHAYVNPEDNANLGNLVENGQGHGGDWIRFEFLSNIRNATWSG
jgi:hypothetical protein